MKIILASKSPRRKKLFQYITTDFITVDSNFIEAYDKNLSSNEIALYLSYQKAKSVYDTYPKDIIIGFDTIVSINEKVLGKPNNNDEAFMMLKQLSNKTHQVITGVTIIYNGNIDRFNSITDVTFYKLSDLEINDYINTREPFDKAGAYAIQGYGSKFVKCIKGDYFTVVGLPIAKLYHKLKKISKNL